MKNIYLLIGSLLLFSCEDVIKVDLNEESSRLVIDANINWTKGTDGKNQQIRLTKTVGFYDQTILPANGATVRVKNLNDDAVYEFEETDASKGLYGTENFDPVRNATYTLTVDYDGATYTATEKFVSVTDITKEPEQSEENFFGISATRVDFFYTDPADEENYYLSEFSSPNAFFINQYRIRKDEFTNGNENNLFVINDNLKKNDTLILRLHGISEEYHNYLYLLLKQTENGGPFATAPALINGNCINTNDPENKPYGFFRLSEVVEKQYIIK